MLLLDERILADGRHVRTFASGVERGVAIWDDDDNARTTLSVTALDRVMARYGKPLEAGVEPGDPGLALEGGYRLRRLRYHATVDATGRDYLVWERPDSEPIAAVATMVTAALRYLARRIAGERGE